MALPYSVRFVAGQFSAGSQVVYTVPAGYRAIVSDICLSITGSGLSTFQLWLPGSPILQLVNLPVNGFDHWAGHQVVMAGETLELITSGGPCLISVSGYLLVEGT